MKKILLFLIPCSLFLCGAHGATLINDTETERVLYELIEPLARAAKIPDGRLQIHIVNDDDFNAFVRGGDDVFLYTGLLKRVKSANALQAVVAHEMGHTIGGHMAHMSARQDAEMTRAMIIQALGIGLVALNPMAGTGVLAGAGGIAQKSLAAFTRDEERVADDLGVDLMIDAGLNPNGFVTVLQQMVEMSGTIESRINPNNINHPLTTERLKNVKQKLSKNEKRKTKNDPSFDLIQAKLIGYLDAPSAVKNAYPNSDKSDAAIYARAIANMRGGNLSGARVGTGTLISRNPDNPYYYELLGDIEYQLGAYDTSIDAYEKSLSLTRNAPQIETALALVLTERDKPGDKTRAIELCKRALLAEKTPLAFWVLARAESGGKSDWALAEYYNMTGKKSDAKKYAKRAQSKLPKDSPEYIKSGDILVNSH